MASNEYGLAVNREVLAAIGATVVRQSGIELTLTHAIICLLGIHPQEGYLVAEGLGFRALCNRTEALVLLRVSKTSPEFKEFNKITVAFRNFNKYRNRIIHSFWDKSEGDPDSGLTMKFTNPSPHLRVTLAEITAELDVASEAMDKFPSVLETILAHPATRGNY
jgi:hypothetical protein